jgi:aminoglycoside phosphotransferase (APT) family kinase protein
MSSPAPDHDTLRAAVLVAFPDLATAPVTVLTQSWDSIALDFDNRLICKFPRSPRATAALRREAQILHVLHGRTTLPIPRMSLHPGPLLFSSHPKLQGIHLTTDVYTALPEPAKAALGDTLGLFYAELHATPVAAARAAGAADIGPWLMPDTISLRALPLLRSALRPVAKAALGAWQNMAPDPFGQTYGFFDGHGWNMAFDPATGRLNGIYDFADSGVGPLHQDFVYGNFIATDLTDRTIAAYLRHSGRPLDPARIDLLTTILRLSELAAAADDPAHLPMIMANADAWLSSGRLGIG